MVCGRARPRARPTTRLLLHGCLLVLVCNCYFTDLEVCVGHLAFTASSMNERRARVSVPHRDLKINYKEYLATFLSLGDFYSEKQSNFINFENTSHLNFAN